MKPPQACFESHSLIQIHPVNNQKSTKHAINGKTICVTNEFDYDYDNKLKQYDNQYQLKQHNGQFLFRKNNYNRKKKTVCTKDDNYNDNYILIIVQIQ